MVFFYLVFAFIVVSAARGAEGAVPAAGAYALIVLAACRAIGASDALFPALFRSENVCDGSSNDQEDHRDRNPVTK